MPPQITPRLAIGMIACHRPNVDVHTAIEELRQAGFDELIHLFCEPGMPALRPMPRVVVHHNPVRRGVLGNWAYCLQWLVEHTSAEFLMVCEDDVAYCQSARRAWESSVDQLDRVGFWSLYTPRRDRVRVGQIAGWAASNRGRDAWGTQCICFPRSSAEIVLKYDALHAEDQMRGATDAIVAQCFVDAGIPCFYHNPSLADHLGKVSSVGHNWYDDHVGLDFDAAFEPPPATAPTSGCYRSSAPRMVTRPRRAAVVTVFQGNIPQEVVSAQAEVICRFLPPGCEFVPVEVSHHALGLNAYFRELHHEAYVIFDIDCIPVADWVIPWLIENALAGVVIGPAQRANHLENGGHIYAGPSALAFSRAVFYRLQPFSFGDTPRGDVGEEMTYTCERLGIPVSLLWPTEITEAKWTLRAGIPFGLGTTFGGAVYHTFCISKRQTVGMFLEKCRDVLRTATDPPSRGFFHEPLPSAEKTAASVVTEERPMLLPIPIFHEQWYTDAELKRLEAAVQAVKGIRGAVLEIGSWEGRSTAVIANACFPDRLLAIDTWEGSPSQGADHETVRLARERDVFSVFEENMRKLTHGNVSPHRQDAVEFLRAIDEPIKFCHIDAAHDYASVRDQLVTLLPKLADGAILFGHDYESAHAGRADLQGGVERAVREVLPQHSSKGNTWSYTHGSRR